MKKQVLVSVTGWTREDESQPESVRLLTTGTLSGAKENWRIDYTETQPDNDAHNVTLTLNQGTVTMQRLGPFPPAWCFSRAAALRAAIRRPTAPWPWACIPPT